MQLLCKSWSFFLSLQESVHCLCKTIIKKVSCVMHLKTLASVIKNRADLRYHIIKCTWGSTGNGCVRARIFTSFGHSLMMEFTLNLKLIEEFSFTRSILSSITMHFSTSFSFYPRSIYIKAFVFFGCSTLFFGKNFYYKKRGNEKKHKGRVKESKKGLDRERASLMFFVVWCWMNCEFVLKCVQHKWDVIWSLHASHYSM